MNGTKGPASRWLVILPTVVAVACGGRSCGGTVTDGAQTTTAPMATASGAPAPEWPEADATRLVQDARRLLDTLPDDSADVAATAAGLGNDTGRIFAFVRDAFAFDPYPGSLRGARGALMARSGNAIDRSLLLSALLKAGGHSVRLVRGTLGPDAAVRLVTHAAKPPAAPQSGQIVAEDTAAIERMAKEHAAVIKAAEAIARHTTEAVDGRVQKSLGVVRQALKDAGIVVTAPALTADSLREHVWVQVRAGSEWTDLDSSFPDATVGRSFTTSEGPAIDPDSVPRELCQRIQFKISVIHEGKAAETVLDHEWTVPELLLTPISLGFAPEGGKDPDAAMAFRPSVLVGTVVTTGRTVALGPQAASAAESIMGAFGGGEEPAASSLRRVQLEVLLHGPGIPTLRSSRTMAEALPAADPARQVKDLRRQLNSAYQFVATAAPVPLDWVARTQQAFVENMIAPGPKPPAFVSVDLVNLARVMVDGDQQTGAARKYRSRPLVIGQRVGTRESGEKLTFVKSIDILHSRTEFLGQDPMVSVRQGVFETALEREALPGTEVFNTSTVFDRSTGAARVFRAGQEAQLAALNLGQEVTALISEDMAAGYVTVVPPAPVEIGGRPATGWWRVRPDGGETIGRMESGEGQSMTDVVITTILGGSFSIYSLSASVWCKSNSGIVCNPCLIAAAGLVGTAIGLYGAVAGAPLFIAWRGISLLVPAAVRYGAVFAAGAAGFKNKASKCVDWLTVGALG